MVDPTVMDEARRAVAETGQRADASGKAFNDAIELWCQIKAPRRAWLDIAPAVIRDVRAHVDAFEALIALEEQDAAEQSARPAPQHIDTGRYRRSFEGLT